MKMINGVVWNSGLLESTNGLKNSFFLSGAPLSVSEEHGYKGPQFASWVTACLVSPNFASLPLNYL